MGHPSGEEPRRIILVAGTATGYVHNGISTAKYNLFNFLPRFFLQEFGRYANCFFAVTALLQQIPNVSPTGKYTTIIPLSFILLCSAVKELFEDFRRHKEDWLVNRTQAEVVDRFTAKVAKRSWKDLKVGDLVLLRQDAYFPADCVLLSTHEPSGTCFIETANLDGESNLKARYSLNLTDKMCSMINNESTFKNLDLPSICRSPLMNSIIECEMPNKNLYEFEGKLRLKSGETIPIGPENVLLRGAKMRNTVWAIGVIVFTGHETKMMLNYKMGGVPMKQSQIDRATNRQMIFLFAILLVICIISATASIIWVQRNKNQHWYIKGLEDDNEIINFCFYLITFIILFNNLIPISLQVSLEMVRVLQAHFINCDLEMHDPETDTWAQARTSNLNEELGQVRFILTDKTGTLTRNVMEFKKCAISGKLYTCEQFGSLVETLKKQEGDWKRIGEFLRLLAICHTVIPEPTGKLSPQINYSASSPDEAALVTGAQSMGFQFLQRTSNSVIIEALGKMEVYEVLRTLQFDSDRKRMSTIIRTKSKKIKLYIKGADSIIAKRLTVASQHDLAASEHAMRLFATEGLRVLCVAYAELSEERYADWEKQFAHTLALSKRFVGKDGRTRQEMVDGLMSEIETDLTLLGITAIEDQLQEGVPETIETLMRAGIVFWMLTGDKLETAINIAYSCRLLRSVQDTGYYHILSGDTVEEVAMSLQLAKEKLDAQPIDFTLVIESTPLSLALSPKMHLAFMDIALMCRSVICCRVTPAQKADVVLSVQKATGEVTLAIGDGANDVGMIRRANLGVGISGREGLQAVFSADYAISQFRFLTRLLLVHGSWNLSRVCKLILFSFYKNIVLYVIEVWYATITAWSGQAGFERWSLSFYNLCFTAAPPMVLGLFDQPCSAEMLLDNPELYSDQWGATFNNRVFWYWIGSGFWHSICIFWLSYFSLRHEALWANGKSDGGGLGFSNMLNTYVVVTVCLKAWLESSSWNTMTGVGFWCSVCSWFSFLIIYSRLWPTAQGGMHMANIDSIIFSSPLFWFGLLIIPFVALLVDIVVKLIARTCFKSLADKIIELELAKELNTETSASLSEEVVKVLQTLSPPSELPYTCQLRNAEKLSESDRTVTGSPNSLAIVSEKSTKKHSKTPPQPSTTTTSTTSKQNKT